MDKIWILVANASVATLYSYSSNESVLNVVGEFKHLDSRKKDHDLASDREGAYRSTAGGHGNFVETSDPHQYEAQVFAHELFKKLEHGRTTNQYQSLILVASAHFLGLLRKEIDDRPLKNTTLKEITKDYTQEKPENLIKLLNLK